MRDMDGVFIYSGTLILVHMRMIGMSCRCAIWEALCFTEAGFVAATALKE